MGVPTLLKTTQLLYRSTSQLNEPTVNVTSVIQPVGHADKNKVISYQSAYDSLDRDDEPSNAISGGLRFGGIVSTVELVVFGLFLAEGYTVIVPDTEGQRAAFAAGGEYGMNTLDSIRAAFASPTVGLRATRGSHCSAIPVAPSPASGRPNLPRPTRPMQMSTLSGQRSAGCSSIQPTT